MRLSQHKAAFTKKNSDHSGAVEHAISSEHIMDWDNATILKRNQTFWKSRKINEAI